MEPIKPSEIVTNDRFQEAVTAAGEASSEADSQTSNTDEGSETGIRAGRGRAGGQRGLLTAGEENTRERRGSSSGLDTSRSDSATNAEEVSEENGRWYQLEFIIARSQRYHAKRRSFFERCNHSVRAVAAIAGAGTVGSVLKGSAWATAISGTVVGIASALDLVFDFSKRAMVYDDLYRRFADLAIKVAGAEHTEENYRLFAVERLKIEKEEPTLLAALNVICYNEELRARAFTYSYRVGRFQKMFCQLFDIGEPKFEKIEHGTSTT